MCLRSDPALKKKERFYLFIFRERGREGERDGEEHPCVVASCMPPTGNLAHNLGVCPDWELNQRPLVCRPALSALSHVIRHENMGRQVLLYGLQYQQPHFPIGIIRVWQPNLYQ